MVKEKNKLFNKKYLIEILKKQKINRISKESLLLIEKHFIKNLKDLGEILKEEMVICGNKILKKEHVLKSFEKIKNKKEGWEI